MKTARKILAVVFLLALVFGLSLTAAAETTYTVRLYAGDQGTLTVGDGNVYSVPVTAGNTFNFDPSMVTLPSGSIYYVKGVREAGLDNDLSLSAITVDRDMDLVVAYGVKSKIVKYTVKYEDTSGNPIASPTTFYGNVGDKPVIGCMYVDLYVPKVLNLTKTLSEKESENVFTFTYDPVPTYTPTPSPTPRATATTFTPTPTPAQSGTTAQSGTSTQSGTTTQSGTSTQPGSVDTGNGKSTVEEPAQQTASADNGSQTGPVEIVDLDTPTQDSGGAEPLTPTGADKPVRHTGAIVGGIAAGIAAIGGAVYAILRGKKK